MATVLTFINTFLFYSLFINNTASLDHPIHLAISELNYNESNHSIEISHKFFLDDIEQGIKDEGGPHLKIGSDKELSDYNEFIFNYIQKHFELTVNEKPVENITFVGTEHDLEAIWVYVEYPKVKKMKSISIKNSMLIASFPDQKNMVHCQYKDHKKSLLFVEGETIKTFNW